MPNAIQNVSMTAPTDYTAEAAAIERRRRLAEALGAQGASPLDTNQMAGGYVVPVSPYAGLAKMLQAGTAGYGQHKADEESKALAKRYQDDLTSTMTAAQRAGEGASARTIAPDPQEAQQSADYGTPEVPAVQQAAVAPDRQAMIRALMGHPATQGMAMAQTQKDMDASDRARKLAQALAVTGGAGGAAAAGGGAMAGVPPQVVALMTSGDPELMALGKALLESSKGIAQRPGAPVVNPYTGAIIAQPTPSVPAGVQLKVGPGGPVASPVPGAIPAMAASTESQAGAAEAGKAPYQMDTVQTPGAPTLMTRQQQIEAATGRPMPRAGGALPGGPSEPTVPGTLWSEPGAKVPPEDREAFNSVLNAAIGGRVSKATPGLALQPQAEGAAEKAYGTERGQLEAAKPQAAIQARTTLAAIDRLSNVAAELGDHPGLKNITGRLDQYAVFDMKAETRAARALQGTLVKQAAVSTLQAMRDASKSGGAVGQVTEKEWPILEQQLAALDAAQAPEDYKVALANLQNQMRGATERIRAAYEETYKEPLKYSPVPYVKQGRTAEGKLRRAGDEPSDANLRARADAILRGQR